MGCRIGMEGAEGVREGVRAVTVPGTRENNRCQINKVDKMTGVEDVVTHLATIRFSSWQDMWRTLPGLVTLCRWGSEMREVAL